MKRTLAAACAAVALTAATPALAANFILTDDGVIDDSPQTASNFYILDATDTTVDATLTNAVSGTWSDSYFFASNWLGSGSGAAIRTNLNLLFGTPGLVISWYNFDGAGLIQGALFDAFDTSDNDAAEYQLLSNFVAANSTAANFVGSVNGYAPDAGSRRIDYLPLDPNYYYRIDINGTTAGGVRAVYSGNLAATSVPEPATWAMMLFGFGVIGFAMRRQRQSHPKVRFAF